MKIFMKAPRRALGAVSVPGHSFGRAERQAACDFRALSLEAGPQTLKKGLEIARRKGEGGGDQQAVAGGFEV